MAAKRLPMRRLREILRLRSATRTPLAVRRTLVFSGARVGASAATP